ncbi:MAG: hydrogenase expression protein HupH [Symploca sp. SIO2B6]|nr:hydrogenase expression protein HupH [Symploca sp. SIO2B6]
MKIRVIAPIVDPSPTLDLRSIIEKEIVEVAAPDAEISLVFLDKDKGPASIESRHEEFLSIASIIEKAQEAQGDGIDGIFIDCFAEPGVGVVRELVDIPVVGGFDPAVLMAKLVCQKFSIVTVEERVNPIIEDETRRLGIMDNLVSIRDLDIPVLDLKPEEIRDALVEHSVQAIKQDGAQAIVLGCTGMLDVAKAVEKKLSTYKEKGDEQRSFSVPVIDPTTAAITTLQSLIRMQLSQSRLAYYKSELKTEQPGAETPLKGSDMLLGTSPRASTIRTWCFKDEK